MSQEGGCLWCTFGRANEMFTAPPPPAPPNSRLAACIATGQDGRILLEFLLAQGQPKLSKIDIQRLASLPGLPRWLMEDLALRTAVTADKRIVIGLANTAYERIAPFMAGRHV